MDPTGSEVISDHMGAVHAATTCYQGDHLKGIVQRKLRWVESGVDWWVILQYWGAEHYF
jgi:hypothetical protein